MSRRRDKNLKKYMHQIRDTIDKRNKPKQQIRDRTRHRGVGKQMDAFRPTVGATVGREHCSASWSIQQR